MSGSMPLRAARWRASSRCRPRRLSSARNWSSCARWKQACASRLLTLTRCRSPSTLAKIWNGLEDCFHEQISRMTQISLIKQARRVVFQGEPGSYSHLAALEALPHCEAVAAPAFEGAFASIREGVGGVGLLPIYNSIHGRTAGVHYLLADPPIIILWRH